MTRASGTASGRAGFSLVEVLIGILILALGLLGLGAIIPVVVRQQRAASDATLGIAAANDAQKYLESRVDTADYTDPQTGFTTKVSVYWWEPWARDKDWSPVRGGKAYLWNIWRTNTAPAEVDFNSGTGMATGDYRFQAAESGAATDGNLLYEVNATIKLADRLWPPQSRQGSETIPQGLDPYRPLFVWDIVGRRLPPPVDQLKALDDAVNSPTGRPRNPPFGGPVNLEYDKKAILESRTQVQVAIFVRRIDLNIRVQNATYPGSNPQRPITLYDVLTQRTGLPTSPLPYPYRVPVAVNSPATSGPNDLVGTGRMYLPTNNGISGSGQSLSDLFYSGPIMLTPTYDPAKPARLSFSISATDNRFRLVSQPGQKIVDNLGNVYTVLGEPEDQTSANPAILIDPPVPATVADPGLNFPISGIGNPYTIRQIVFVPQIPAAVKVFTISRPEPQ